MIGDKGMVYLNTCTCPNCYRITYGRPSTSSPGFAPMLGQPTPRSEDAMRATQQDAELANIERKYSTDPLTMVSHYENDFSSPLPYGMSPFQSGFKWP